MSRIDRVARALFPLSFTVFNIVYWLSYFQVEPSIKGVFTSVFQTDNMFDWADHKLVGERHWG